MSRIDLTPADTTATGVRPNSVKSALISHVSSTFLWTPPMPPVTKTSIPAIWAHIIVPDTVVAPTPPAWRQWAISLLLIFLTFPCDPSSANLCNSLSDSPTCIFLSMIAIVAGTAPCLLTTSSIFLAHPIFWGYGMPWLMIVDSSATTAFFLSSAYLTWSERITRVLNALVPLWYTFTACLIILASII